MDNGPYFTLYKDNYFIAGTTIGGKPTATNSDVKFQVSIAQRLTKSTLPFNTYLYLFYTQKCMWNVFENSMPMRDFNFNPGIGLAKHLFVPITVVAYLYLGLTYGGYPYLVKLMVPKRLRAIKMTTKKAPKNYDAKVKLAFAAILCAVLCFLFPVASPLFFSLFLGVAVRESGMKHIYDFVSGPLLYGSTFMLGLLLGVLCDAKLLLDPKILKLLVLGIAALLLSGIGGILGGYIMYFIKRGNYNPVIGIAAVSCVPTTAKVAQKIVSKENPDSFVLGDALGANISGVITSAIITGIYITIIPYL